MSEKPCSDQARAGPLAKAKQFLAAADVIEPSEADDITDAYVTLCVHGGIAAADVICCARLGRHHQGDNHVEAVGLLNKAGGSDAAKRLNVLLGLKSKAATLTFPRRRPT
jgi:hypothetical protein